MKKNGLFTFVTACVPGFGQMYYGYMRRGVSLASWFFGISFLAVLTGLGFISFVLPVIWRMPFSTRTTSATSRQSSAPCFVTNTCPAGT